MLARWLDRGRRSNGLRSAALVAVAVALTAVTLGCCTVCPQPTTHAMAFGARTAGCADDCLCVCPVPDIIKVEQGDEVWFVNTSEHQVTITATSAGTFEAGDVVVIPAKNSVLVSVKDNAPVGTFDLTMAAAAPALTCPGLASPRIIVNQKPSSS